MTYTFRPLVPKDRALLDDWLSQPHIDGWWGDAASEWALIKSDLAKRPCPTDMRIVEDGKTPFAYIQDYNAHAFDAPHYSDLPKDARAFDTFLGDPAYLGKGHAKRYMRQRIKELIATGAPLVAVDPDVDNTRAIAAYRAAGLTGATVKPCEDGTPVLILTSSG